MLLRAQDIYIMMVAATSSLTCAKGWKGGFDRGRSVGSGRTAAFGGPIVRTHFSTGSCAPEEALGHWRESIATAYFNLQLAPLDGQPLAAQLDIWDLSSIQLSRLESTGLRYQRAARDCRAQESQALVTVPLEADVEFSQLGRTTRCSPGQYLLEMSDAPYDFGYGHKNAMWVLKFPAQALKARIGDPSKFSARRYDSTSGVGRLFRDYLRLVVQHCEHQSAVNALSLMGTHLVDLLAISFQQHPDALQSSASPVRDAHLVRTKAYILSNLADPTMAPESIARACSISPRYLHSLFKDTGDSVSSWIKDQRLQAAYQALNSANGMTSIAQIAYGVGFSDHAHFSNAFRSKFGHPPSEMLARFRSKA